MYERRFLRVLTISLIPLCFGILLFFQISVYAQSDEDVRRTSDIIPFLGYPVYGVSPLAGTGFPYAGIGLGGGTLYPANLYCTKYSSYKFCHEFLSLS